ncbi:acyltransferase family protein [Candidatus Pristimantibacillus sp. PTI5]|uniref:acyltransferase family protein n=1 Tax=Candidatus Pristimantibacillus sp. PTI5 TaxID=3400422 RepID=UPI003B01B760
MNNTITGLRGLLALIVVLFHIYGSSVTEKWINPLNVSFMDNIGHASVSVFFVISGYLIIQTIKRKSGMRHFWNDRFLRILPVFLCIHFLVFIIGPLINYKFFDGLTEGEYFLYFFANMLMMPGIFDFPMAQVVAWSLSYEMAFYIVASSLYFSVKNYKKLYASLSIFLGISIIWVKPLTLFFLVGVAVYILEMKFPQVTRKKVIVYLGLPSFLVFFWLYGEKLNIGILLLLTFFFFVTIVKQTGMLSKLLGTKTMIHLGQISYSLYLWHTFVMFPLKMIMHQFNLPFVFFFVSSIILSIIVAHISYRVIEVGITNLIKQRLTKKKQGLLEA